MVCNDEALFELMLELCYDDFPGWRTCLSSYLSDAQLKVSAYLLTGLGCG